MKRLDPVGPTMTALLAAGQLAAWTLLGVTVQHSLDDPDTTAAAPDTPQDQTDPPPTSNAA